jgi:N-dimethylarginine dimethylaminohydrolase
MQKINSKVLMTGADYFTDDDAINALMDAHVPVDKAKAIEEHNSIKQALIDAGVEVIQIPSPLNCQDAVYTANWGLVRSGKILMSRLPNKRKPEEAHALKAAQDLGLEVLILPEQIRSFSGQGDALCCGNIVFTQSPFRTSKEAHPYLKSLLGYEEVIELQTKPLRWFGFGPAKKNKITGWIDSPTYDIDLAISILKFPDKATGQKGLIAYCPEVFKSKSRRFLKQFDKVDKIEVSKAEAMEAYALNLLSTGETVIMNNGAPMYKADMEAHGLKVVTVDLTELKKGGGSIRCSTLSLDN